jgi:hypothetical protein
MFKTTLVMALLQHTQQNLEKAIRKHDVSKPMYDFGLQTGHIMAWLKET